MAQDIAVTRVNKAPFIPPDVGVTERDVPRIQLIFIASAVGSPMLYTPEVTVYAYEGLAGDRHRLKLGSSDCIDADGKVRVGNASLMAREDIEYGNSSRISYGLKPFLPKETRRNFITTGADPKRMVRKVLKVGSPSLRRAPVYFFCVDELTACDRPARLTSKDAKAQKTAFKTFFAGIAGVKLIPLTNGVVKVDDPVEITDLSPKDIQN